MASRAIVRGAAVTGSLVGVLATGGVALAQGTYPGTGGGGGGVVGGGGTSSTTTGITYTTTTSNGGAVTSSTTSTTSSGLPYTGFEVGAAAVIGLGALGAGTFVVVASRRRRNSLGAA